MDVRDCCSRDKSHNFSLILPVFPNIHLLEDKEYCNFSAPLKKNRPSSHQPADYKLLVYILSYHNKDILTLFFYICLKLYIAYHCQEQFHNALFYKMSNLFLSHVCIMAYLETAVDITLNVYNPIYRFTVKCILLSPIRSQECSFLVSLNRTIHSWCNSQHSFCVPLDKCRIRVHKRSLSVSSLY